MVNCEVIELKDTHREPLGTHQFGRVPVLGEFLRFYQKDNHASLRWFVVAEVAHYASPLGFHVTLNVMAAKPESEALPTGKPEEEQK